MVVYTLILVDLSALFESKWYISSGLLLYIQKY